MRLCEICGIAVEIKEPRRRGLAAEREAHFRGDLIIRRKDNAAIIATIRREDLVDVEGNPFEESHDEN